ncbi:MAG: sortase domain-bontaining protein [Chloroflexota bacterium]
MDRLRTRLLPATLTALGVTLLAAGLLNYIDPVSAEDPDASPTTIGLEETPSPSDSPSSSVEPTDGSPSPDASASSSASTPPSAKPSTKPTPNRGGPTWAKGRVATRVVYPALDIDLAVIKQPDPKYPSCGVAMYHDAFGQPGQRRATYIYAHARTGMFLPLLEESRVNDGRAMLGDIVEVYTSDDQHFLYEVTQVRRHVRSLDTALAVRKEELWLQTSEGPNSTYPKLQVRARFLAQESALHAAAHPRVRLLACH